jgi:hypothetical protein
MLIGSISLGVIVSSLLSGSHERSIYQKICDDVSNEEVEVMRVCGIGKDEDNITKEDFIVLMLVRIGAAPTQLILKLHDRFRTLDRKGEGRIAYDDIVYGRKKKPSKGELISRLFMRSFSMKGLSSLDGPTPVLRKSHSDPISLSSMNCSPVKVYPTAPDSFMDMGSVEPDEGAERDSEDEEERLPVHPSGRHRGYTVSPKALEKGHARPQRLSRHASSGSPCEQKESADLDSRGATRDNRDRSTSAPPVMQSPDRFPVRPSDMALGVDGVCGGGGAGSDESESEHSEEHYDAGGMVGIAMEEGQAGGAVAGTMKLSDCSVCSVGSKKNAPLSDECNGSEEDDDDDDDEEGDQVMPMPMVAQVSSSSRHSGGGLGGSPSPRAPRLSKVVAYQLDVQKRQDLLSTIELGNKRLLQTIKEYTVLIVKDSHFILFSIW